MYHIDGDRTWGQRARSENLAKFRVFAEDLRKFVVYRITRSGRRPAVAPGHDDPGPVLARLLLLTPFYCIETWLYQNTEQAIRICRQHYQGQDVDKFQAWQRDRTLLDDDVQKPKTAVCLGSRHNRALAASDYPIEEVYQTGRSLAETIDRWLLCNELSQSLPRLHWRPDSI